MANKPDFYRNCSFSEAAKIFNMTRPNFNHWAKEGMPNSVGRVHGREARVVDTEKVIKWMVEREAKKLVSSGSGPISADGEASDDRYRRIKADLAQHDLDVKKGKVIQLEEHEQFCREAGDYVRKAFQAMPRELGVKLAKVADAAEIENTLELAIVTILRELSERKLDS